MFSFRIKILHWIVSWWSQTLNKIREKMQLQLLEFPVRMSFWKNILESYSIISVFFFLSAILLPIESVRSLMHAAIVLNS